MYITSGREGFGMKPEPRETKLVVNTQTVSTPEDLEPERGTNWRRFNPNVKVTEDMMWHPPRELMHRRCRDKNPQKEPTWPLCFGKLSWALLKS